MGSGRDSHCRIVRASEHETMPYFPGPWFPKRDPFDENGLFEACMLMLFKPWRNVVYIKSENQSFCSVLDSFLLSAPTHMCEMIQNIRFYHKCCDRTFSHHAVDEELNNITHGVMDMTDQEDTTELIHESNVPDGPPNSAFKDVISEQDVIQAFNRLFCVRELLYADVAINVGQDSGALHENCISVPCKPHAANATPHQVDEFH